MKLYEEFRDNVIFKLLFNPKNSHRDDKIRTEIM